jgi:hypothetical protein
MKGNPRTYSKKFKSRTLKLPSGHILQIPSDKDLEIRETIINDFCSRILSKELENNGPLGFRRHGIEKINEFTGFDGKYRYDVKISAIISPRYSKENVNYSLNYLIQKSGKEGILKESCDLEKFLFQSGFSQKRIE